MQFSARTLMLLLLPTSAAGQIPLGPGDYSEDFNSLISTGSAAWTNDATLPGWYASRSAAPNDITNCTASAGTTSTGGLYSFGTPASSDRALGSLASGGTGRIAFGVRLLNDSTNALTDFALSITGEQWRVADSNFQSLRFSFRIGADLTNADATGEQDWTPQPELDFRSPVTGPTQPLNGNDPANQRRFTSVLLPGVVAPPGKELFLRWLDDNDPGYDDALALDDVTVTHRLAERTPSGPAPPGSVSLLTYNTHGNQVEDWSTNSYQVRAIGRQLAYLHPDLLTLNEIPETNTWQMENWIQCFLPGYFLATNSTGDGSIRNVIASRFPITRSQSWLHGCDLAPFGCTNVAFKRDLFEAEISVPEFPRPLHIFVVHLKSGQDTASSLERGAEAAAVSNFFAVDFPARCPRDIFTLSGDMNEDLARPPASFPQTVTRLVSVPTGLRLTTPLDPTAQNELTFSIQNTNLNKRYDYILPCVSLYSNIASSAVFRSDEHPEAYPLLHTNDSRNASDHLPVFMRFQNPYDRPFRIVSFAFAPPQCRLSWESVPGQSYCIETSTNLAAWNPAFTGIPATNFVTSFNVDTAGAQFVRVRREH